MIRAVQILFLCLVGQTFGYNELRFTDCHNSSNSLYVTVRDFGLRDYPIVLPGHLTPTASVDVHRSVSGHLRLNVSVKKFIVFDYFELPCISYVGSCSYDLCDQLAWFRHRGCPWQLRASNFPCTCPIRQGAYHLDPRPFHVPRLKSLWQWLAFGDYKLRGSLTDERTEEEVGCYELEFTVQQYMDTDMWNWFYV